MVLCTAAAALFLVYSENTSAGVIELLNRSFGFRRVTAKLWYVPTILLMPCIMASSYLAMRLIGVPLPIPQISFETRLTLSAVFFIGALTWQLFPVNGSYYDPRSVGLITAAVAVVVVLVRGPRTLVRARGVHGSA